MSPLCSMAASAFSLSLLLAVLLNCSVVRGNDAGVPVRLSVVRPRHHLGPGAEMITATAELEGFLTPRLGANPVYTINASGYQPQLYCGSASTCRNGSTLAINSISFTSTSSTAVLNVWIVQTPVYTAWLSNTGQTPSPIDPHSCLSVTANSVCKQSAFALDTSYLNAGLTIILYNSDSNPQGTMQVFTNIVLLSSSAHQSRFAFTLESVLASMSLLLLLYIC